MAAFLVFGAGSAMADTTVPIPLTFDNVVLATSEFSFPVVSSSTSPLTVTADVDTTTGAFTIAPTDFSIPTYSFSSPTNGTVALALNGPATGTVDFTTGAVTMSADILATINTASLGNCVIDTGALSFSTSATKPLLGTDFPAGATGVASGPGAFAASWSTLPASTNGSGCSTIDAAVDNPGGLWISKGITPAEAVAPKVSVTAKAKAASIKAGKSTTVDVTVANTGGLDSKSLKVCVSAKKPLTAAGKCQTLTPAPASKKTFAFKVAASKAAKAGVYKLTVTATGLKAQTIKVKVTA